ncbi:MAG: UDP-2,3-diacylglucosamine diphosphatase [Rhodocyclaceae bacterium]|nr:UDP-2,3-diacylglucosamine diphosphatase [Rhodocyclaceae bacterium]
MLTTFFVADIHLHPARTETTQHFCDFLAGAAKGSESLYILGDLFDAWVGDDDLSDPFNTRITAALKNLTDFGTKGFFLPGNRDFLIGEGFAAATGFTLLEDETVINVGGVSTLLLHGDTLCTNDHEYQAFRTQIRSTAWRQDFLSRPLAERKALIETLRQHSEQEKQSKPAALMDVSPIAVQEAFHRHAVTRLIHGHTHVGARYGTLGYDERWVLPEWHGDGCFWLAVP